MTATKTDASGRFSLTRESDPAGRCFARIAVHPGYYAEVGRAAIESDPTIRAQPWGGVEGVARIGGTTAVADTIRYFADQLGNADVPRVSDSGQAVADVQGRFSFNRVVPGDVRVARMFAEGRDMKGWSNGVLVDVKPGETARAEVGGKGWPVIARIARPPGFDPNGDYAGGSQPHDATRSQGSTGIWAAACLHTEIRRNTGIRPNPRADKPVRPGHTY